MNRVFWVRHGENRANLTREFSYKRVDYPLTAKGILQAEQTADYFASQSIDAIYASPLQRARGTAEIIAARLAKPVTIVEEFREINVGNLEGAIPTAENWEFHDRILADWWEGRRDVAFPAGESGYELGSRMRAGFRKVLAGRDRQNIVVVAHGGCIIFGLVDLLSGQDTGLLLQTELCNCGIVEVNAKVQDDRIQADLVSWGAADHLTGLAVEGVPCLAQRVESPELNSVPAADD